MKLPLDTESSTHPGQALRRHAASRPETRPTTALAAAGLLVRRVACGADGRDTGGSPETTRPAPATTATGATAPGPPAVGGTFHFSAAGTPKSAAIARRSHTGPDRPSWGPATTTPADTPTPRRKP